MLSVNILNIKNGILKERKMTRYEMYIKESNDFIESAKDSINSNAEDVCYRMSKSLKDEAGNLTLAEASEIVS